MERNKFKVPVKQWTKWSEAGRMTFNEVFDRMQANKQLFQHTDAVPVPTKHWKVTAWNAAWMAATAADAASRRK